MIHQYGFMEHYWFGCASFYFILSSLLEYRGSAGLTRFSLPYLIYANCLFFLWLLCLVSIDGEVVTSLSSPIFTIPSLLIWSMCSFHIFFLFGIQSLTFSALHVHIFVPFPILYLDLLIALIFHPVSVRHYSKFCKKKKVTNGFIINKHLKYIE